MEDLRCPVIELCQLLYLSQAVRAINADELGALSDEASKHNLAHEITGILVYSKQRFIQVLEGPTDRVEELFFEIERDPRHQAVRPLFSHTVRERAFSGWSMKVFDCDRRSELDSSLFEDRLFAAVGKEWAPSDTVRAMRLLVEFARRGTSKSSAA